MLMYAPRCLTHVHLATRHPNRLNNPCLGTSIRMSASFRKHHLRDVSRKFSASDTIWTYFLYREAPPKAFEIIGDRLVEQNDGERVKRVRIIIVNTG